MQTYLNSREIFDFRHFLQLTSDKNQTDVFPEAFGRNLNQCTLKFFASKSGHFKLSYLIFMVFEDISMRKAPNVQYKSRKNHQHYI